MDYHYNFYSFRPIHFDEQGNPTCFYIEGKDGSMLIGDQLPATEEDARQRIRCANIAHRHAVGLARKIWAESMDKLNHL